MNGDTGSGRRLMLDLAGLIAFGMIIRTGYLVWLYRTSGFQQFSDFQYLFDLAVSLSNGEGFTLAGVRIWNQSPGYPMFLAPFLWLFGEHVAVALSLNVTLGGSTIALVGLLAHLLYRRRSVTLIAGALAAVYPDLLLYTGLCAAENLLLPLTLGMACASVWRPRHDAAAALVCGALAAWAASVKALILFAVPVIPLLWITGGRRWVRMGICAAAAGMVLLSPWTLHNYRLSGHIVPFAAVSGEAFLDGNNPHARGVPSGITTLPEIEALDVHPVERDRAKARYAVAFIREQPLAFVRLLGLKGVRALVPVRDFVFEAGNQPRFFGKWLSRIVPTGFNLLLYIGIAGAFIKALRSRGAATSPEAREATLFAVGVTTMMGVIQLVFFAYSRYRLPFLVLLLPAVADAIHTLTRAIPSRCRSNRAL